MYLAKSRFVSVYEERKNSKKIKKYFIPTSFSPIKKSKSTHSSLLKNEDF